MSSGYNLGDVVLVQFPFSDNPQKSKLRPAVIIEINDIPLFLLVQITGTNKTGKCEGRWVISTADDGQMMGLLKDSFLNYSNFVELPIEFIYRKIGVCPYIEEIKRYL